jgi:hypothetical protein
MAAGAADKVREIMIVERSANTTLTPSLKVEGGLSPLVHDAKGVQEQVVLFKYEGAEAENNGGGTRSSGSGGSAAADIVAKLVIAGVIVGATLLVDRVVIPRAKRYWVERKSRTAVLNTEGTGSAEIANVPEVEVESPEAGSEVDQSGTEIAAQQWYELFFDAVAHGAASRAHLSISAENWAALASAHVIDDPETQALARAMRALSPEEVAERVDRLLQVHHELLDEDPESVLRKLFGDGADAPLLLPIKHDDIASEGLGYLRAEAPEQLIQDAETPTS